MEFLKIIFLCILAAICYGIVHDQITARVCVEYFTIGHPPVFHTESPTLLGLGWGVMSRHGGVRFFLGVPCALALVAQVGNRSKLTARAIAPSIFKLLCVMGAMALSAGITGYILFSRGTIAMPRYIELAIPSPHIRVHASWQTGGRIPTSYAVGFSGGIVVIVDGLVSKNKN